MRKEDNEKILNAVSSALNLLWSEIDGVYDDELRHDYESVINKLAEAESLLKTRN